MNEKRGSITSDIDSGSNEGIANHYFRNFYFDFITF